MFLPFQHYKWSVLKVFCIHDLYHMYIIYILYAFVCYYISIFVTPFCMNLMFSWALFYVLLICHLCLTLQQLMRERQQMASRPFASVAVALDARGEQTELLQSAVDVSLARLLTHTNTHKHEHTHS